MPVRIRHLTVAIVLAGLVAVPAARADDLYLKINGITGGATDKGYEGSSEINDFTVGVASPGSGGKATFADLVVHKPLDRASPFFLTSVATGKTYPKAILSVVKTGAPAPFLWLRYCFTDVVLTKHDTAGDKNGALETVGLRYGRIVETYSEQDPSTGAPKSWVGGYDLINGVVTTSC